MIKLDVPLVMQDPKSNDCGLKCIEMVSKYYNKPELIENIGELNIDETGVNISEIASYLLRYNFEVTFNVFSPEFFNIYDFTISKQNLKNYLKKLSYRSLEEKEWTEELIDFIDLGGKISVKIPDYTLINQSLLNNLLMIYNCTSRFIYTELSPKINYHFMIIKGINSNFVFINDPYKGDITMKYEHFLYSTYSISNNGFKSGGILIISPKN